MWNNTKLFIGGSLGVLVLMFLATIHPDTEHAARTDSLAPAPAATTSLTSTRAPEAETSPARAQSEPVQSPSPIQPAVRPSIRGGDEYEDD